MLFLSIAPTPKPAKARNFGHIKVFREVISTQETAKFCDYQPYYRRVSSEVCARMASGNSSGCLLKPLLLLLLLVGLGCCLFGSSSVQCAPPTSTSTPPPPTEARQLERRQTWPQAAANFVGQLPCRLVDRLKCKVNQMRENATGWLSFYVELVRRYYNWHKRFLERWGPQRQTTILRRAYALEDHRLAELWFPDDCENLEFVWRVLYGTIERLERHLDPDRRSSLSLASSSSSEPIYIADNSKNFRRPHESDNHEHDASELYHDARDHQLSSSSPNEDEDQSEDEDEDDENASEHAYLSPIEFEHSDAQVSYDSPNLDDEQAFNAQMIDESMARLARILKAEAIACVRREAKNFAVHVIKMATFYAITKLLEDAGAEQLESLWALIMMRFSRYHPNITGIFISRMPRRAAISVAKSISFNKHFTCDNYTT